ncbi:MAG: hypothetical protein H6672_20720 [Anaerolineaceae bacterium]|nr:hypothetical protein [Anaerolineaceae bacterium]
MRSPCRVLNGSGQFFTDGEQATNCTLLLVRHVEQVAPSAAGTPPGRQLETNVEFYTALVLHGTSACRQPSSARPLRHPGGSALGTAHAQPRQRCPLGGLCGPLRSIPASKTMAAWTDREDEHPHRTKIGIGRPAWPSPAPVTQPTAYP